MNKYLYNYNSHSILEESFPGTKPNVIYDNEHVHYNYEKSYALYDILYENSLGQQKVDSSVLDPQLGWTPIGLCVAPTNFFGDGEKARFVSLKYMNYTTPDTGSLTPQIIYFGQYEVNGKLSMRQKKRQKLH